MTPASSGSFPVVACVGPDQCLDGIGGTRPTLGQCHGTAAEGADLPVVALDRLLLFRLSRSRLPTVTELDPCCRVLLLERGQRVWRGLSHASRTRQDHHHRERPAPLHRPSHRRFILIV